MRQCYQTTEKLQNDYYVLLYSKDLISYIHQSFFGHFAAILNPRVFVECGGVGVVLHNVLDCAMPRINEALLGAVLYLLNTPQWRPHCTELHQILAPFSDFNYKHTSYDLEYYSKRYSVV